MKWNQWIEQWALYVQTLPPVCWILIWARQIARRFAGSSWTAECLLSFTAAGSTTRPRAPVVLKPMTQGLIGAVAGLFRSTPK